MGIKAMARSGNLVNFIVSIVLLVFESAAGVEASLGVYFLLFLKFRYEFRGFCLTLDGTGKLLWRDGDGAFHEFRHVVALVELEVEVWVVLWHHEWLAAPSRLVHVAYVEACEASVVAAAAEENPSVVRRPAVIALHVGRIKFCERARLHGLQVYQIEVSIFVPDVEAPIGAACEE